MKVRAVPYSSAPVDQEDSASPPFDFGLILAAVMQTPNRWRRLVLPAALCSLLWPPPAAGQSLFAQHRVTLEFATAEGHKLVNAEVRVFGPGNPGRPSVTGRTDSNGRFEFAADRDGFWSAEARDGDQIAHMMVRVGGQDEWPEPLSPYWLIGGLLLLLVLAVAYRLAGARRAPSPRRGPPPKPP